MSDDAVVVLGMARSGTSAVTRLLALLGVELGSEQALLPPAGENAKGFYEHRAIIGINKELLRRLGGSWSEPPRPIDGWQRDPSFEDLRSRARELIAADFAGVGLWGFKDPRTSLTLPFWDELLEQPRYVICHRRPLDSARSLEKRDGIRLDDGVALWTRYTASALAFTAGRRRILLGYEELFANRQALVGDLAEFLGVAEHVHSPALRAEIEQWVQTDLRHHASSLRELLEHPAVSAEAQALHLLLELAAARRRSADGERPSVQGDRRDVDGEPQSVGALGIDLAGIEEALDGMARTLLRREAARAALMPSHAALPAQEKDSRSPQPLARVTPNAGATAEGAEGVEVSIVVVLADDPWGAMACLESISELAPGSPAHETLLVDNASRGLRATLDALAGQVRVLRLPQRLDALAALRLGVEAARGEVVVSLPEPALLAPDALIALWAEHMGGAATVEAVGSVGAATTAEGAETVEAATLAEAVVSAEAAVSAAHISAPPAPLCRRGPGVEPIAVSIVIPTLDAASEEVRECLRAVQATLRVAHEIVVIDNGAPPQGFTAPVNAALRAARGRHLVVMNDDVRVLDGWWEPLADALDRGAPLVFPLTAEGRMRWEFAAWCFAMRRETFQSMAFAAEEFFDPSMFVWCQDADLRKRLSALGTPPLCVPESRIRHAGSRTVRVGATHQALRNWIHAQAARDTEIYRERYPQETSARERDGLPPGIPILTAQHAPLALAREAVCFRADGPEWVSYTLAWPERVGHFFLAGEIEVRSPDSVQDILVRVVFAGAERELHWIDLVPGAIGTGRLAFTIPRERARPIRLLPGEAPADWSQVCSLRVCARSRLRGALRRSPSARGATTAVLTNLRLLALPAEVTAASSLGVQAVGSGGRSRSGGQPGSDGR